jgi:hypothetical protein
VIIEIALGILLAFAILATAVIWIPLVAGAAVIAAIAGVGYLIYLQPFMFLIPALFIAAMTLVVWFFNFICTGIQKHAAQKEKA